MNMHMSPQLIVIRPNPRNRLGYQLRGSGRIPALCTVNCCGAKTANIAALGVSECRSAPTCTDVRVSSSDPRADNVETANYQRCWLTTALWPAQNDAI